MLLKRQVPTILLLVGIVVGCTLEPRNDVDADLDSNGVSDLADDTTVADGLDAEPDDVRDPAESVRVTLEVFREATRVGDLSLALSLLDRDAVLIDDGPGGGLAGSPSAGERTRGEFVVDMRRAHAEGLRYEVVETQVRLEQEMAVVLTTLRVTLPGSGEDAEMQADGPVALETAVLDVTPDGWRIVHLHRSGSAAPGA